VSDIANYEGAVNKETRVNATQSHVKKIEGEESNDKSNQQENLPSQYEGGD
jgi:hypothetical protein